MTNSTAQTTALVLLDLQDGNLSRLEDNQQLIDNATRLLKACREQRMTIAHVKVAFEEEEYQRISPQNKGFAYLREAGSAIKQGIHTSLPHMQFHSNFTPLPNEIVVRKTRIGAFTTTDLDTQLQNHKVNKLILVGIATSGAVLSTARDACDKDYAMTIISDACADRSKLIHDFLIEHILPKSCDIITTDGFLESLA